MRKPLFIAIAMGVIAAPAFADEAGVRGAGATETADRPTVTKEQVPFVKNKAVDPAALSNCPPIGQSAKGELIYSMDCEALKPENRTTAERATDQEIIKDSVVPNSAGPQTPDAKPTKAEPK